LNDLLSDLEDAEHFRDGLRLLGSKGATGTQASFLELFHGDHAKVAKLDSLIALKMGFKDCYPVSGQTYSRKIDSRALNVLSGIAQSAAKFSNDLRLLQHLKEIEEPFEKSQVGSSAMAYKRNPMMCERMAALARFIVADSLNPAMTASAQWLERTLDDSANRRISVAEAFLATDGLLDIFTNVTDGLVVYPKVIEKHLLSELPFMATENIMMDAVSAGGDRQILHERIRELSRKAAGEIKMEGKENDLIGMLKNDPLFAKVRDRIDGLLRPELFVGMAPEQVEEFIGNDVDKALEKYAGMPDLKNDVTI
jgi:adenylosuccinate lyase